MGKIEANTHFLKGERANCATTVFHALIPESPRMTEPDLLYENAYSLQEIAYAIAAENEAYGLYTNFIEMPDDIEPSSFFRQVYNELKRGPNYGTWNGGLLLTLEEDSVPHVIGIKSVKKREIFEIIDTSPHSSGSLIRNVRGNHLDRRIFKGEYSPNGVRALAFATIKKDELNQVYKFNPTLENDLQFDLMMNEYMIHYMKQRQG